MVFCREQFSPTTAAACRSAWRWRGANRHDFKMARETIESIPVAQPEPTADTPQRRCLDKGYDDDEVHDLLAGFGFTAHIRARGEEAKALKQEAMYKARR
jgi:putative transposase